jgi:hypothetical protein
MLQGEARGPSPGGYPQLVVDGDEVRLDGARAKEELFGDPGAGHSCSH